MVKRILVVDDDPNIRRIVSLALSDDSPYEVHAVASAEAALLHIARQPVDLLFTDIRMPGMNGLELVQRVRELDPTTAVIVFTVSPQDLTPDRAALLKIDCLLEKPVSPDRMRLAVDLLLDPIKLLPRPSHRDQAPLPPAPPPTEPPPTTTGAGPLGQRLASLRSRKATTPLPPHSQSAPIAVRLTPRSPGLYGRSYSEQQIEAMRQALKELALEPDVHCAVLADLSGIVLTHWSRRRDINITVVAALAAGNTMALAEIGRNLGQQNPGHLVIHEGQDQSILMATMNDLLLLIAIGPNASLGWARIATLRACEEILKIAYTK
ncbi:roadblock/LC7 domain-containing protein [Candidatus Viridilinea mediisalina]|uniref:Response regulator receiver protein n=1 Tax=Candidatus Viridilinea mediisalina TaxID=2024553 RepID=A0A2A6RN15_9CHLR|nr:roadblock/LC7 domain-containing protein [Candidatus Viridilinea mediisalina]PDW04452.1 response regulator receiver protein [Candidatus Viridilinea mediisalina]